MTSSLTCIRTAISAGYSVHTSKLGASFLPLTCHARGEDTGLCIVEVVRALSSAPALGQPNLEPVSIGYLCREASRSVQPVLQCLWHQGSSGHIKGAVFTVGDVRRCLHAPSEPSQVRVLEVKSSLRGEPFVTAGHPFTLSLQVLDQYDRPVIIMTSDNATVADERKIRDDEVWVLCSLSGSETGAVLWSRPALLDPTTGRVQLTATVSLPGPVQLKISAVMYRDGGRREVVLGVFGLEVRPDPDQNYDLSCLFVFTHGMCSPAFDSYTETSSVITATVASDYLSVARCLPTYRHWGLLVSPPLLTHPATAVGAVGSGGCLYLYYVSYQRGVDAVWTGHGLPGEHTTPRDALKLPPSFPTTNTTTHTASARQLRKAYHIQSKIWHPDRWVNTPAGTVYMRTVQNAFECVTRAYEALMEELSGEKGVR